MQNNKGWDFLTTFADINDNYIYQASKPWKENKIVIVQHYIRGVAACILLVAVIGVGLIHQKKVEAAAEELGIELVWRVPSNLEAQLMQDRQLTICRNVFFQVASAVQTCCENLVKHKRQLKKMGLRFLWRRLLRMKKVSGLHIL